MGLFREKRVRGVLMEVCPANLKAAGSSPAALYSCIVGAGYQAYWVQGFAAAEHLWLEFYIPARSGFHFHNTYIEVLVELGFVGFALLVLVIARVLFGHLTRLLVLTAVSAGLIGVAWLLLMPVAVWWIASAGGWPWHSVAGVLGAAHLFVGVICVLRLKSAAARLKLFEETINQCRRDRECLGGSKTEAN